MNHFKDRKRLSLILSPLVALVLILNLTGTISLAGLASAATGTSTCPTNASVVTDYHLKITRNGQNIYASSFASVKQGDHVKVSFDLDDRCTSANVPISLVSYQSPAASYDANSVNQRVVYQSKSGNFDRNGGSQEIDVPGCYFSTGFVYGSVITHMSPSSLYGSRKIDWQDGGTKSCSNSSSSTSSQSTSCPNDASAVASYYFTYGGSTTHRSDLSGVKQGDDVKAYFTLKSGCQGVTVSLAAYTAKEPYWNPDTATQQVYMPASNDTGTFDAGGGYVHTVVPVCFFQIDFVWGGIIQHLDPTAANGLYGNRKIAWLNGGTNACGSGPNGQEVPQPTPTNTPTKIPTTQPSNTPANTPANTPTNTPTNTATATPILPVAIQIHVLDTDGNHLDGATIDVSGQSGFSVTDNGDGDGDPANGEIRLSDLPAGGYLGQQTVAKSGYYVDTHSQSSSLEPGQTGDWTFVDLRPGGLKIHVRDGAGANAAPVAGGCFDLAGPGLATHLCDNAAGDLNPADGELEVYGLTYDTFTGHQTDVLAPHIIDSQDKSATVPGELKYGEMTFVNPLPVGDLQIVKVDNSDEGHLLQGACFTVDGPNDYEVNICDNETANDLNRVADEDPAAGLTLITGLAPGAYFVWETEAPQGFAVTQASGDGYDVTIDAGQVTSIRFVNPPDTAGAAGTYVYIHKLNCTEPHAPGSINGHDVATGTVPPDCTVAPGVDFEVYAQLSDGSTGQQIEGPDGPYFTTDGTGTFVVFVEKPIDSVTVVEHLASNPLADQSQNDSFGLDHVQNDTCPCHATDKVIVNKVSAATGTTSGGSQPSSGQQSQAAPQTPPSDGDTQPTDTAPSSPSDTGNPPADPGTQGGNATGTATTPDATNPPADTVSGGQADTTTPPADATPPGNSAGAPTDSGAPTDTGNATGAPPADGSSTSGDPAPPGDTGNPPADPTPDGSAPPAGTPTT
ncbi:MAG TPA: hypothetical protein VH482_03265 [Thermomicrobiales bacterium]|jgi:hypothetical protein